MEIWFKEFQSHGRQVLVKKSHDADESKLCVYMCWPEEKFDVEFGPTFIFDDEDEDSFNKAKELRDKAFDNFGQSEVDQWIESVMPEIEKCSDALQE
ncbi:hypothetical protein RGO69_004148 [Morganella morganii]|nr:hypothetical protein [Morganella morganii]